MALSILPGDARLPQELWAEIGRSLPPSDRGNLCRVCKTICIAVQPTFFESHAIELGRSDGVFAYFSHRLVRLLLHTWIRHPKFACQVRHLKLQYISHNVLAADDLSSILSMTTPTASTLSKFFRAVEPFDEDGTDRVPENVTRSMLCRLALSCAYTARSEWTQMLSRTKKAIRCLSFAQVNYWTDEAAEDSNTSQNTEIALMLHMLPNLEDLTLLIEYTHDDSTDPNLSLQVLPVSPLVRLFNDAAGRSTPLLAKRPLRNLRKVSITSGIQVANHVFPVKMDEIWSLFFLPSLTDFRIMGGTFLVPVNELDAAWPVGQSTVESLTFEGAYFTNLQSLPGDGLVPRMIKACKNLKHFCYRMYGGAEHELDAICDALLVHDKTLETLELVVEWNSANHVPVRSLDFAQFKTLKSIRLDSHWTHDDPEGHFGCYLDDKMPPSLEELVLLDQIFMAPDNAHTNCVNRMKTDLQQCRSNLLISSDEIPSV
jgi:hypothetical protein